MSAAAEDDLLKRLTEFINTWALYSPYVVTPAQPQVSGPDLPERILRFCRTCNATPTWVRGDPIDPHKTDARWVGEGSVVSYQCSHCEKEQVFLWFSKDDTQALSASRTFKVTVRTVFRKLGQWPPQRTEPDPSLGKALPESLLELFKKGLTSIAHGYGIGALAYFRRVVEDGTTQLLDLFAEKAEAEGDKEAAKAIRAAKEATRMEDRLRVAAEALPASLRPGGVNPLAVLYHHYSRGIHAVADDECLAIAMKLEFAMTYIFKNWKQQIEMAESFKRTVQEWSDTETPHERKAE